MSFCEYCGIDGYYGREILRTGHWIIYLAPSQRYLGTCVLALKRKCRDLSELDRAEWNDFSSAMRMLEAALRMLFSPDLFNWSCFKNSAFRDPEPDPEVHWHFIPRYSRPVHFAGECFTDPDFGHIPLPIVGRVSEAVMDKLESALKDALRG